MVFKKTKRALRRVVTVALVAAVAAAGIVYQGTFTPAYASDRSDFINVAGPAAQRGQSEYGVPASVTVAQAILESGWGKSDLAVESRNHFGIKCASSGDPGPIATGCRRYATTECTPECHTVYAYFRVYNTMEDSFRDHGAFLRGKPRYANAFNYTDDPDQFVTEIWKAGYATDPDYPGKVIGLMRGHDLYRFNDIDRPGDRDISGDGYADLMAIGGDAKLYYYPNNINGNNGVPFGSAAWASLATWGSAKALSAADISGDGYADLMMIDSAGDLNYYPNNINGNSGGAPFTSASWKTTGGTWGDVKAISAGDISGDGFADLMVIGGDGNLYYYPNNINGNSGGAPFTSASWKTTGGNWGSAKGISAGDISGDGHADLMMIDSAGDLNYYPNNINSGGAPFTSASWKTTGGNWGSAKGISAGDISGDGYADLMMIDSAGNLNYYPNNINGNSNGAPFTSAYWKSTGGTWTDVRLAN